MLTENNARQVAKLNDLLELTGMLAHLNNQTVMELMLNPDGQLWVEEFGKAMYCAGEVDANNAHKLICAIAHYHKEIIDRNNPVLECELPTDGSRFEGLVPPLVAQTSMTIRKKATRVFTLAEYVTSGIMTEEQKAKLESAVAERRNILIVGGTGSGKTTLANALIEAVVRLHPNDRVLIIEDTNEIQCQAKNAVIMRTYEKAKVGMKELLRVCLRSRPDRILVGEVRGGEALDLLKAWNTGHPGGLATIHADSPVMGLERLEQCIREVSAHVDRNVIASTIHTVVFIKKTEEGQKRVDRIIEVTGCDEHGKYLFR